MDKDAQRILERAKLRKVEFEQHIKILDKDLESEAQELLIEKDCDSISWSNSNEEKENSCSNSPSKYGLRDAVKSKLDKLGKLYAGEEVSSPIHRSFEGEMSPKTNGPKTGKLCVARSARLAALASTINNWEDDLSHSKKPSPVKASERPKILASRNVKETKQGFNITRSTQSPLKETRKLVIEDSVAKTLESQGFQRCESKQHLVYDYSSPSNSPGKCLNKTAGPSPVKSPCKKVCETNSRDKIQVESAPLRNLSPPKPPRSREVLKMAAKYEETSSPKKQVVKDPTELSIADRKALFERGDNGTAILPKAPFAMAVPVKVLRSEDRTNTTQTKTPISKTPVTGSIIRTPHLVSTPSRAVAKSTERPTCGDNVTREILERRREIEDLRNRWDKKRQEVHNKSISAHVEESESKIEAVPPPPPPMPASPYLDNSVLSPSLKNNSHSELLSPASSPKKERKTSISPVVKMALENVKPIRVISPPKGLYPSVHDIETDSDFMEEDRQSDLETISEVGEDRISDESASMHESSMESENSGDSFGAQIVASSRDNSRSNLKRPAVLHAIPKLTSATSIANYCASESSGSSGEDSLQNITADESRVLHEIDDFLDEALGDPTPSKKLKESCTRLITAINDYNEDVKPSFASPCKKDIEDHHTPVASRPKEEQESSGTPLVYTVSLYRKQQTNLIKTPIRREVHTDIPEMMIDSPDSEETVHEEEFVQKRMEELKIEVKRQLTIISQASQALNLCMSSIEFSGSTEELEAEKLLLLATARRIAATHELERLTVERKPNPCESSESGEDGTLKIETLAVKAKRIPSALDETIHLLCLVKSGCTVQATEILPLTRQALTDNNRLLFKKPVKLEHTRHNTPITVELYSLTNKSFMALQKARGDKEKLKMTPKKGSKKDNKRHFAVIESPAGPNAVRSPSFQMIGFMVFTMKDIARNHFTLNKVPGHAPIEGFIEMTVKGQVNLDKIQHAGFLTLFQEIGGFGAWKRCWSILRGQHISFCSYPEPERALKSCFETIDLSECITREVGLAPKDICVRSDTIMLECKRYGLETENLRYLLSADSIKDRLQWCQHINKVLSLLRLWNPVKKN